MTGLELAHPLLSLSPYASYLFSWIGVERWWHLTRSNHMPKPGPQFQAPVSLHSLSLSLSLSVCVCVCLSPFHNLCHVQSLLPLRPDTEWI